MNTTKEQRKELGMQNGMNKEIKKMAQAICGECRRLCADENLCDDDRLYHCDSYWFAEQFYKAGYRKVDCDEYVSREWHDEQVLHAEEEIKQLKEQLSELKKPME